MKRKTRGFTGSGRGAGAAALALLLRPEVSLACATCAAAAGGPQGRALGFSILTLGLCIGFVLAGFAGFILYLRKRAARFAADLPVAGPFAPPAGIRMTPESGGNS